MPRTFLFFWEECMIATLTEIKTLLGISDTTYDAILQVYMPIVQAKIITLTNNAFLSNKAHSSDTISFDTHTATDSEGGFVDDSYLSAAVNIRVDGSKYNDGYYTVSSVADGAIVVSETFTTETAENTVTINQVNFPEGLKIVFAQMCWYSANSAKDTGVISEALGGYSVTYDKTAGMGGYPKSISDGLKPYTIARYY